MGEVPSLKLEKGNRIPPQWKLYHLRRGVTNKMALKVVATNKVCESRTVCNRPPTDTLPLNAHRRENVKTRRELDGINNCVINRVFRVLYFISFYFLICAFKICLVSVSFQRRVFLISV